MRNRTRNQKIEKTYRVYLIPIVMAVVILPLLVMCKEAQNPMATMGWNNGRAIMPDIFLCIKRDFLYVILACILFFMLCFWLLRRKIFSVPKYFVLIGVYLLLALLSACVGLDAEISWNGAAELMQPVMMLVAYMALFYYMYIVVRGEENARVQMLTFVMRAFLVLALLLTVTGVFHLLDLNYLEWDWLKSLLGMEGMKWDGKRMILTLYHADYVGTMMTMLVPMCLTGAFYEKKRFWRILYVVAAIGCLMCLLGARSRAGLLALCVSGLLMFVLRLVINPKHRLRLFAGIVAGIVIFAGAFILVDNMQENRVSKRLFKWNTAKADETGFSSIETMKSGVRFTKGFESFSVSWKKEGTAYVISCKDSSGKMISYKEAKDVDLEKQKKTTLARAMTGAPVYALEDSRYEGICFRANSYLRDTLRYDGFTFFCGNNAWFFTKQNGTYKYLNLAGRLDDCVASEDAFPKSFYPFASYRGYVWSKTIALLPEVILFGVGSDNFGQFFPNNDYVSKAVCNLDGKIYNRPHNYYLQMATDTGVLSTLCIIVFFVIYVVKTFGDIVPKKGMGEKTEQKDENHLLRMGCFASIIGYLIVSLINDSMVVTAPVFWVILGMGYALLKTPEINRKKSKKSVDN